MAKVKSSESFITDLVSRPVLVASFGVVLLSAFVFSGIIFFEIPSDIQAHVSHVVDIASGEKDLPPNFLYYVLVYALSGLSGDQDTLTRAAIAILSLAVLFKFLVTLRIAGSLAQGAGTLCVIAVSIGMVLAFSPPSPYFLVGWERYYLGMFTPNVWHNSTVIFLFPFALLLFWVQVQSILNRDRRAVVWIWILVALNIFAKPSFFMAYAPATMFFLLMKFGWRRELLVYGGPVVFGLALLAAQYFLIYNFQLGSMYDEESHVSFSFFDHLRFLVSEKVIPFVFLFSFAFPIVYFVSGLRPDRRDVVSYSLLLMMFSLLIYAFLEEEGPRFAHGNFFWQNVVAVYILVLVLVADVLSKWFAGKRCWKIRLSGLAFSLHVVSGVVYLGKVFVTSSFY